LQPLDSYHDGLFYIGVSSVEESMTAKIKGFEPSFRGRVVALDAKTGKPAWELFLCHAPASGVAVWGSFALDAETKTLFFATGNDYNEKGTGLSDAIVAADARTGKIRWSRQVTAHDVWTVAKPDGPDYDFGTGPQLFESRQNGRTRKLVGAGQKNGVYHAVDRETGEVVWQSVVGYGQTAGGIMGDASVGDGRIFVWSNNSFNHGKPIDTFRMTVKALNANSGETVWSLPNSQPAGISTAGFLSKDVYFVPSLDGRVRAYHAGDGKLLWTSPEGEPAIGATLNVSGDALFVGRGLPKAFDGDDAAGGGVFAYSSTQGR
jgi:polyvinyl alcohol dehydrogenase (cytochrome)